MATLASGCRGGVRGGVGGGQQKRLITITTNEVLSHP
jgi:hypothetical protein